ncbi:hypothetical protein [Streptomyces sp. W1SF4]|uniref:hypothetical protein n=1 Tax=Streptomyces sp. W1SF4 TaxID=2305220 RepID=UPI000F6DE3EF|nr:hypothetical protein [Streptomyces sp. W1SF4]AZM89011.1 hypothetical protein D1J60_11355 [Streptomyces sp. W1SF4]
MHTQRFMEMAGEMMRSALKAWRGGNRLFAALHAGMGAEHALKAILCHHDPLLISAHGDRALRFHALGFSGERGVKPLEQARTIGMAEAFKDAEVVMRGQMPVTLESFTPVMDARNGIAHLAHHDPATGEHVVATALKVAEAVRKVLKTPTRDFWGDYVHVFGDLAQVAAMPDLPEIDLQRAAEGLAQVEAAEAEHAAREVVRAVAATASEAITQTPLWGDPLGTSEAAKSALNVARRAIVSAALYTTATRAQRATSALLRSYGYLSRREPTAPVSAHDAVAVKTLVAREVEGAFASALPKELQYILTAPSSDVIWRPRLYEPSAYGMNLSRWETCPACPAWGDFYGYLEPGRCSDFECNAGGSYCGQHDEGPPTTAHARAYVCPMCCLVLDTDQELEAAYMEMVSLYEG